MASSKRSSPLPRIVFRLTAPAISAAADVACGTSPTKRSCGKSSAGYRMPCGASAALQWSLCLFCPPPATHATAIRLSFPLGRAIPAAIPAFLRRAAILSFPAGIVPCSRWFSARSPHGYVIMPMHIILPSTMSKPGKACCGIFICVRRPPMAALCFALSSMAIKCPMPGTSPGKRGNSSLPSPPYC